MCSIKQRFEKLKKESRDLRKAVKDLKETLVRQNELIINLLSKQTETIEKICVFSWRFPLDDLRDLKKLEDEINDKNKNHIINIVQPLLAPKALSMNISNVLSDNLIMDVNVDGCHNKARLLSFPKTLDILFQAWHKENNESDSQTFLSELRKTIRAVKYRIHKNNFQVRKKLKEQQEHIQ